MPSLAKLAVGTLQDHVDARPMLWSLLNAVERAGPRVQSFVSRACVVENDAAVVITGQSPRQLDSWLMTPDLCRRVFESSSERRDLALVEGRFCGRYTTTARQGCLSTRCVPPPVLDPWAAPTPRGEHGLVVERFVSDPMCPGSGLETIAAWLDLPRVAVLDVAPWEGGGLPPRPPRVEGVLLDGWRHVDGYHRWRTEIEALWRVPVMGGLPSVPHLRHAVRRLAPGERPPRDLCAALGDELAPRLLLDRLWRLAESRPAAAAAAASEIAPLRLDGLRIALAYDDAFGGCFPDNVDLLAAWGAEIVDFSPLKDERLPAGVHAVYFGDGFLARWAERLAANVCMHVALRNFVHRGGRVFAEGGAVGYLAGDVELADGRRFLLSNVLPIRLRQTEAQPRQEPVEFTLRGGCEREPLRMRGYHDAAWTIQPDARVNCFVVEKSLRNQVIGAERVLASQAPVYFRAQPKLLGYFIGRAATSAPGMQ